ncbi:hypothetical protein BpHYR1_037121 [Brachionus plicatilis]|uniref:Uncharacterized protein n=1 Tax=Brachionus plicatilis TaxID=10195 RepID=A0A3M7SXZ8_BRAPC|nr:hypothetical protein BpHYR1_037121 [Brachionus plicatilis]
MIPKRLILFGRMRFFGDKKIIQFIKTINDEKNLLFESESDLCSKLKWTSAKNLFYFCILYVFNAIIFVKERKRNAEIPLFRLIKQNKSLISFVEIKEFKNK